ncbi:MAG: YraN family protein [Flavobacteriaceae bacterium]
MKSIGIQGEQLALAFLENKGYKTLEQNMRLGHWEADVVMKHHKTLVIVEVKTSSRRPALFDTKRFSRGQYARLLGIGSYVIKQRQDVEELRIDLIMIYLPLNGPRRIRHYQDISMYI